MAAPYGQLWCLDFEFTRDDRAPGPVEPLCLCAYEVRSGRQIRVWQDELWGMKAPPFDIGDDSCLIAYAAGAEALAFASLSWSRPRAVIDLFAEFILLINVTPNRETDKPPPPPKLSKAMRHFGLPFMESAEKDYWRSLAINPPAIWTRELQGGMLDYNARDTDDDRLLFNAMEAAGHIDWPRAVWRGCASFEFGYIEHNGLLLDVPFYRRILDNRAALLRRMLARSPYASLFPNGHFSNKAFAAFLNNPRSALGERSATTNKPITGSPISGSYLKSGELATNEKVRRRLAEAYPEEMGPLNDLMAAKAQLERSAEFPIASDDRIRWWCRPYGTVTGRCNPYGRDNILGAPKWMRPLLKAAPGTALVILDWKSQEPGIAAGRSRDPNMIADYQDDFHRCVAVAVDMLAPDASLEEVKVARDRVKPISLGTLYGRGIYSIAAALRVSIAEATEKLVAHRRRYAGYWQWVERQGLRAASTGRITALMGWSVKVRRYPQQRDFVQPRPGKVNLRALQNFQAQAGGAEMLRAAIVLLGRAGFKMLATAHDSILFEIPLATLERDIVRAQNLMERVSLSFTRTVRVTTSATIVRPGKRWPLGDRDQRIWELILALLEELEAVPEEVLEEAES